jgi:HlyD family secretion protein
VWKWLIGIFVVLAVACGVGGFFASKAEPVQKMLKSMRGEHEPESVKVEAVSRGDLTRSISAPGAIDPKTKVKISARVSARVIALPFKEGQDVNEGDVIVRLDAEDLKAALDQVKAQLRADEARLEGSQASLVRVRADVERARKLFASKDRSQSELDAAEADFLVAEASLRAAQQAIESSRAYVRRAERDLENTVITSPISGTIVKLNTEVGEVVLGTFNNAGTEIMQIADLTAMLMRAEIDENNIEPIKPGQKATVYINAYPDRKFTGLVERLKEQNQISREGKQYFEAEIALDLKDMKEGERLKTGLKANCDIQVETKFDVMKVPSQAVLDRRVDELPEEVRKSPLLEGKNKAFTQVVYRMIDGKAKVTPVETGSSDVTSTVVLSGLEAGTTIITGPYKVLATLKDDMAVKAEAEVKPEGADEAKKVETAGTGGGK